MPDKSTQKIKQLHEVDRTRYKRAGVGCLVLSHEGKITLQQRDENNQITFPGYLSTFGGAIEPGETPLQALIRELHEELGAEVKAKEVIYLGAITEAQTNFSELLYVYFWHDKHHTITGCYEGTAMYYSRIADIEKHPRKMDDVHWLLQECQKRKLIRSLE